MKLKKNDKSPVPDSFTIELIELSASSNIEISGCSSSKRP
jgi:hypothetical protein